MMNFNRLTASEYRLQLEESGLEIREFRMTAPTVSNLHELSRIKVHKQFRHVPEREFAARYLFFVIISGGAHVSVPSLS